jgi:hypothetical protein
MKQLMKIIGVKVVYVTPDETGGTVELTLAPLASGNLDQIMQEVGTNQKFETKVYMTLNQYLKEIKNQPLSDVWLEVTVEAFASDISKRK